jgi:alpha-tubulin suppressor-like RCC1 family protein
MPQVNTSDIQARYNEQLARLYYLVEYSPDDVLAYVLSGVDLSDINIIVSADVDSLPNLQYGNPNVPDGMVYFVQSLGIIVISSNGKWLTLDGVTIRTDTVFGQVWGWGCNGSGRLGDNTTVNKSSPVSVVGGFNDWCQVSAAYSHTMAVRSNGTLWAWGAGGNGALGTNNTNNTSSPVSVVGGFTDWCQVTAGGFGGATTGFSLGVRTNGTLWAWGFNASGNLGDNTGTNRSSPVSVVGGFTDWCQVSASIFNTNFTLAVRQNGTAWAWGCNSCGGPGQLGDGTTVNKSSPVSVVGGFTDWCQISAGDKSSLAVRQNGTLWAWGYNGGGVGMLGNNSTTNRSSPVSVVGGFTDWCQVSIGAVHSLGVRQNGTAWAWGSNSQGRLGDNTTVAKSSPISVVGGFTDWCQVSAGSGHSLGVRQNGSAWGWGCGCIGRLGDNTTVNKSSPVSVIGGFNDWCQVSAGYSQSLAIRNLG